MVAGSGAELDDRARDRIAGGLRQRACQRVEPAAGQEAGAGGHHVGVVTLGGALGSQVHVALAGHVERVPLGAAERARAGVELQPADRAGQRGDDQVAPAACASRR